MLSLSVLALGLTLIDLSAARVANHDAPHPERDVVHQPNGLLSWFNKLVRKHDNVNLEHRAALDTCVIDAYYNFVFNSSFGQNFCGEFLKYPNSTVVQEVTPTTTTTFIYTTTTGTDKSTIYTTPVVTVTVTGAQTTSPAKREATPAGLIDDAMMKFRQVAAENGTAVPNDAALSASFSSACNCQQYNGPTITSTRTAAPVVETLSAFDRSATTILTTRAEPTRTVYTTVVPKESSAVSASVGGTSVVVSIPASSVSAGASATPTAPAFSCPEDNNTIVSQMVGTFRYDYLVLCGADLTDEDVAAPYSYGTYSECAAACSVADTELNQAACEAFAFYTDRAGQGNCYLKASGHNSIPALGIDIGILQEIVQGVSEALPAGTNTDEAPFVGDPTIPPAELSSTLSFIFADRSTAIPVITPGPSLVQSGRLPQVSGETSYSTYVSDGTTFSTGTAYSTNITYGNSWYATYYTSWSQAWSSATTVYASSETSTAVSNSTSTESTTQSGTDGTYYVVSTSNTTYYFPGGYNVTSVIGNETFNADGTAITSTATTSYYTIETGASSGGESGALGSGAGNITSTFPASASISASFGGSYFVSNGQTIFSTGGGNAGGAAGAAGGALQTPAPSGRPSAITNTYGTAGSSGFIISGQINQGGAGGANSTEASGALPSTPAGLTPISSTVLFGSTGGVSATVASGSLLPTGISGESQTAASGSGLPFTNSLGSRSGSLPPSTGLLPSGSLPSSPSSGVPFTNSLGSRSGSLPSPTTPAAGTGSLPSSGFGFTVPFVTGTALSLPSGEVPGETFSQFVPLSSYGSVPQPSSGVPFTNSLGSRSGSLPPSGTAPPTSGVPFTNSLGSRSGTLPPSGTAPGTAPVTTFPPFPTAASSCLTNFLGTTTIFTTVTEYGCYSNCPPVGGVYGAQTFGPPTFGSPTPPGGQGQYGQ